MKNRIVKRCLLLGIIILLPFQLKYVAKVSAEQEEEAITVLFTHDLHDNLLPLKTYEDGKAGVMGGFAGLSSEIQKQKEIDPQALLVDGGDFSMGTPFQTIFQTDAPELRLLGAMGYDAVTLGNHEFDYRPSGLAQSLTAAINSADRLPCLVQSNVSFPADKEGTMTQSLTELKQAMEAYGAKDYTVLERKGIRIGIFGLMGKEAASMAPMSEVVFRDEVKEAKRVVKLLKEKEKVDLILCLSHSGTKKDKSLSEDEILAARVPDINVIISAHTHTKLSEPIIVGNTVIGSAEDYGKYLGVIKLMKNGGNTWSLSSYQLVPIDESIVQDSAVNEKIETFKSIVQNDYFRKFGLDFDEIIAHSDISFQTPEEIYVRHAEATIGNLISDAYIYAVKKAEGVNYKPVTAAIVPCGTIRGTIFKGDITAADAFSISSLGIGADGIPGYPLISVYLTGKELKTVCEVDASIAPIMEDAQLFMSGISYTFNPHRLIFNKVTKANLLTQDNREEPLDEDKLYRVVCGLYSAQMLSVVGDKSYGLMSVVPKNETGEEIKDFEADIIYDTAGGGKTELKEWYALVQYLKSFDQAGGIPQIPVRYETVQGRKVIDRSRKLWDLVKEPNAIAITVYIAIPVILAILLFLTVIIVKHARRRHRKA